MQPALNPPHPYRMPELTPPAPGGQSRNVRRLEDLLLILAIFPLWPKLILGWPGLFWDVVLWVDVAFLAVLLAVRWGRLRKALKQMRSQPEAASPANQKRERDGPNRRSRLLSG